METPDYKKLDEELYNRGWRRLMPQEQLAKIPLPLSYQDYKMLVWKWSYNTGSAMTMPEPLRSQFLAIHREELRKSGIGPWD